jgi:hypothetical protein
MNQKPELTLHHVAQTDTFIALYKQNKCWSYSLVSEMTEIGKLHYGVPICFGMDTKKEAKEAGLYHLAQNMTIPESLHSLNKALEVCPADKAEELKRLFYFQNRYGAWKRLGYDDRISWLKACNREFPMASRRYHDGNLHGINLTFTD